MTRPSPHLSWAELACHDPDRTPYPLAWRRGPLRAYKLALVFERFRAICGGHPLTIGSGYRTPEWNRKQGGATKSQHAQGKAIDLHVPAGGPSWTLALADFHGKARMFARMEPLVGGLGLYRWGVHLDVRTRAAGRLVVWSQVSAGTRMHDAVGRDDADLALP